MYKRMTLTGIPGFVAVALLVAGCSDLVSPKYRGPERGGPGGIQLDVVGDQSNGTLGESGTMIIKGFNPTNPHHGDAIVATFFWLGSTNIIDSVTDHITQPGYPPVGNKYTLVEYVTAGGVSMATYVATNVQNFPDAYSAPGGDSILAVRANLSTSVTDGGIMLSAWSGANAVYAQALGGHQSASGSGSTTTVADPGSIPVNAGSLAYAVTLSNSLVDLDQPAGFTYFPSSPSDAYMKADGEYALQAVAGSVDPRWTWHYTATSPGTWLATVLALKDAFTKLAFTVQPSTSLPCPVTIQPPVAVAAQDDQGNTVTSFNGSVTIAIKRNGGALQPGTLSGTLTAQAVNGVARFGDLCIDQPNLPGNGYTLQATVPSRNLTVESAAFSIGVVN